MKPKDRKTELSLYDLFDNHRSEMLEVRCESEKCKRQMQLDEQLGLGDKTTTKNREVVTKILRAPEILCINLNRVFQDHKSFDMRRIKLRNDVEYPEHLDLREYTADGERLRYRLFGVAAHGGRCVESGHWIAAVRHSNGINYRTVNDEYVEQRYSQTFNELRRPMSADMMFDPSVLVYVRIDEENATRWKV